MTKRIALLALVFALAAAVILTGCAPARRPYAPGQYDNTGVNTGYDVRTNQVRTNQDPRLANNWGLNEWNNPYGRNIYDNNLTRTRFGNVNNQGNNLNMNADTTRAGDIERVCERVQGVEDAIVVVTGNTAYVGVDLDTNGRNINVNNIKNQIAQRVRAAGQDINTVYVSADADFMDRLRRVGQGIRDGRPINAFTTELNEMVQRLTPTRW